MYSNQKVASMDPSRTPEALMSKEDNPRVKSLQGKSRSAFDEKGERLKDTRCVGFRDALFEAILDGFYQDPSLSPMARKTATGAARLPCIAA